jgi:hypothetical protein
MTQQNQTPRRRSIGEVKTGLHGQQVPSRPHDSGSQANETLDLDATTESLRHAAEDTRRGADPENTGV